MIRRGRLAHAVAAALLAIGLCPAVVAGQVFIASKPHPEFWIAPVLITANISAANCAGVVCGAQVRYMSPIRLPTTVGGRPSRGRMFTGMKMRRSPS